MKKAKVWTIANIISLIRIGSAPLIIFLMYLGEWINRILLPSDLEMVRHPWLNWLLVAVFIVAGVSDLFDGYLARSRNEVTTLGKFLDPLADKIIVTSCLIMLVHFDQAPAWVAIVIILREITITAMRSMASSAGIVIAAGPWGKAKTVAQNIALGFLLLHYNYFGIPVHTLGTISLYAALFLTVYSGWDYMNKFFTSYYTDTDRA